MEDPRGGGNILYLDGIIVITLVMILCHSFAGYYHLKKLNKRYKVSISYN